MILFQQNSCYIARARSISIYVSAPAVQFLQTPRHGTFLRLSSQLLRNTPFRYYQTKCTRWARGVGGGRGVLSRSPLPLLWRNYEDYVCHVSCQGLPRANSGTRDSPNFISTFGCIASDVFRRATDKVHVVIYDNTMRRRAMHEL